MGGLKIEIQPGRFSKKLILTMADVEFCIPLPSREEDRLQSITLTLDELQQIKDKLEGIVAMLESEAFVVHQER